VLTDLERYRLRPAGTGQGCEYAVAFPHFIEVCGNVAWYWASDLSPWSGKNTTERSASEMGPLCARHFAETLKDGSPSRKGPEALAG
jgi:hypothetical protein